MRMPSLAGYVALASLGTLAHADDLVVDLPHVSSVTVDQSIEAPTSVSVTEIIHDGYAGVKLWWPSLPGVVYGVWAFMEVTFPDGQRERLWVQIGLA